jgi:cytochrome c oxidase subunit 4
MAQDHGHSDGRGEHGQVASRAEPGGGVEHAHPTGATYLKVALFLTIITAVEVWVYYIPAFVESRFFVPSLLIMSAIKFATVVMFYMHLRYDHRLFRVIFTGPLIIAVITIISLLFLFGQIALRLQIPT